MKCITLFISILSLALSSLSAQESSNITSIKGTIKNPQNGNLLPEAQVTLFDDKAKKAIAYTKTDINGQYQLTVPKAERYKIEVDKATYFKTDTVLMAENLAAQMDFTILNKPGYTFDVTIFDKAHKKSAINSLRDCKVEIYNNTTQEQELAIESHPKSVFNFPFNEGNHYTILVRKPGYINRRIEAYVNVNGCILCVDGMGVSQPDVVALMTNNNEVGYFLGNIDLDSIAVGKKFVIPNIYYDFDKSYIRADAAPVLDKLAIFLMDNPSVQVELGSHTDARGSDPYNMSLSDRRAEAAVKYLIDKHGINPNNITWKGYGESELVNICSNGAKCAENEHQMNRRTELKITGILSEDPLWKYSLKQIIEDKNLYHKIIKLEKAGQGQPQTVSK
jgi:outer membrane protein OmpA-like peptidoglycan-associated protein